MSNPLLTQDGLPRFSAIRPEHVEPAIDQLLADNRRQIDALLDRDETPTWENFVEPTVLSNINTNMDIWHDETFGPVVMVCPFRTEDEAIALAPNGWLWRHDLETGTTRLIVGGLPRVGWLVIVFVSMLPLLHFGYLLKYFTLLEG